MRGLILLVVLLSGCATVPPAPAASADPEVRAAIREEIRRERVRQQILNHGKGGCLPDFATGGCL